MFAEIEPAKLKLIAFMSERNRFSTLGRKLMRQGDTADAAYLNHRGLCRRNGRDAGRSGDFATRVAPPTELGWRDGDPVRRAAQCDRSVPKDRVVAPAHLPKERSCAWCGNFRQWQFVDHAELAQTVASTTIQLSARRLTGGKTIAAEQAGIAA